MGIFDKNRGTTSSSAASTLIAKGCTVSGELKVENDVQIDGIVDGQLNVEGTLVVAESGRVTGDVYAKQLIINGILDGNCHAEHIQVLTKGRVSGKIWSNNLRQSCAKRVNNAQYSKQNFEELVCHCLQKPPC